MTICNGILEPVGVVTIPATHRRFVAREKFGWKGPRGRPRVAWVGEGFNYFLRGKIEKPMKETRLRYATLARPGRDSSIMAELGDTKVTALATINALMKRQSNCEDGVLLTNGSASVFYVENTKGEVRALYVSRGSEGWNMNAFTVDETLWDTGTRVFFPDSSKSEP